MSFRLSKPSTLLVYHLHALHVFGHYFKVTTNEYSQNVKEEGISQGQGQGQGPFLFYFFFFSCNYQDRLNRFGHEEKNKERKKREIFDGFCEGWA